MARILIVEDEGLIAMYAESVLRAAGHDVVGVAYTKAEAIELTLSEAPDLVLMDINLRGGESGIDAAKALRGKSRFVFCTAEGSPERLPGVSDVSPFGFLKKPYQKEELVKIAALADADVARSKK